jgi:molybdopterin/thiamine biosynthesis adenylyltransferase
MDHIRHSGLFNASDLSATLVGCGGIGAAAAIALAKMGLRRLNLYDEDTVEVENIATQFHPISGVGRLKVEVLRDTLKEFSDETSMITHPIRVVPGMLLHDFIVISAVDSIQARQDIFNTLDCRWYIDARMAAEEFHLFVVDMHDCQWYQNLLFAESDNQVPDLPCTSKATIYCGMLAAAEVAAAIKAIAIDEARGSYIVYNIRKQRLTVLK